HPWLYGIRMPGEAEEPLGVHPLDGRLPLDVLVAGIRHPPARRPSGGERAVHLCMEPLAEFDVVREGAPDPGKRRLELDPFLDAICVHMQPLGGINPKASIEATFLLHVIRAPGQLAEARSRTSHRVAAMSARTAASLLRAVLRQGPDRPHLDAALWNRPV